MKEDFEDRVRKLNPAVSSPALILAALSADELEAKNALSVPRKEYIALTAAELAKELETAEAETKKRVQTSFTYLMELVERLPSPDREKFAEELKNSGFKISDLLDLSGDPKAKIAALLPCQTLQELLGFSSDMTAWIYGVGRDLFKEGKIKESWGVFYFLLSLNPFMPNYWIALALTEKELGNEAAALLFFTPVLLFDPENPIPRYNCAEIYLKQGHVPEALLELEALSAIIDKTGAEGLKPSYEALLARALKQQKGKAL